MNDVGLVSVVIPMYNSEKTIIEVLESVRKQTALDYIKEIIIVNDGSKDNSETLVNKYKAEHPLLPLYMITQSNGGVSKARNAGMKKAVGKYIALLDSDDEWLPEKLKRQLEIMEKNPQIFFLGAGQELRLYFWKKIQGLYKAKPRDVCWRSFPVTPSVIFRRECIEKVGFFDENRQYCEDVEFFQRFFKYYNFYYLAESLVNTGIQKEYFGETGLTRNLKGMHEGRKENLDKLYEERLISFPFYLSMQAFNEIKYLRRKLLVKCGNKLRRKSKC